MIFDGPNKVIELELTDTQSVSVFDIYAYWKIWVAAGNAQYSKAMSSVGGDPITGVLSLGSTFFLENDWKIKPREAHQELEIVGNLYTRDESNPLIPTTGVYRVLITTRVSNLIDTIATGGSSLTAADVWDRITAGNIASGSFGSLLLTASQGPTPVIDTSAIATAVWSKDISGYSIEDQAGTIVNQISGSQTSLLSSVSTIALDVSFIKSIEGGRWKIENNMMKFYRDDNVTLVAEFNLFDSSGAPSEASVFERVRL